MNQRFLFLLTLLLLLTACGGQKVAFVAPGSGDVLRLSHVKYSGKEKLPCFTHSQVAQRSRTLLKKSELFTKDLTGPAVDMNVVVLDLQPVFTGVSYSGSSTMRYEFTERSTGNLLLRAKSTVFSRSTVVDAGQRRKDLCQRLIDDNVSLLIAELESNGSPQSEKTVEVQGSNSNLGGMLIMSPLYAIATTGMVGVKTVKVSGQIAKEAGRSLANVDVEAMEEQFILQNWDNLSLAEKEAYNQNQRIKTKTAREKAQFQARFDEEQRRRQKNFEKHGTYSLNAPSGGDIEYIKRVCYYPKSYGFARQASKGDGRYFWDETELKKVPWSGKVLRSDTQIRQALGIELGDKSTLKFAEKTVDDSFKIWFTSEHGRNHYEQFAIIKDVMVYNKASRGFASQSCKASSRPGTFDNRLEVKYWQRDVSAKQSIDTVELIDGNSFDLNK